MANSAFSPTVLTLPSTGGTGQGELNLVLNSVGAADATGWVGATRQSSGGPLNPTVGTYFTLSAANSVNESSTSGSYYSFTLPSGLQNRKLKVEFYYTSVATDVVKVSVYKGTTRVPLSTDSSGSTTLPSATTGKFTAYFDTDSSGSWSINVTRTSGSGSALQFTQVVVGPGIQPQGAVVGEWTSYAPTIANVGTATFTTSTWKYRRVGTDIEISGYFIVNAAGSGATNISIPLPLGTTINTSAINQGAGVDRGVYGYGQWKVSGVGYNLAAPVYLSTSAFEVFAEDGSGAGTTITGANLLATNELWLTARLPIAEWAGSGTVQLAQNDVEYAWNSGASTTLPDTTSFGYGPGGVNFRAFSTAGLTGIKRRVKFQSPIQPGDIITVEVSDDITGAENTWLPATSAYYGGSYSVNDAGTSAYGILTSYVSNSNTEIDVFFQIGPTSGVAWRTASKWRVRKSSAGAAVGMGLVSQNSAGLMPASNSNLDDATATRLGLKQYLHGTTYNGVALTVTGATISKAAFIPYQLQDSTWRMKFSIATSHALLSTITLSVPGVTTAGYYQAGAAWDVYNNNTWTFCSVQSSANSNQIGIKSGATSTAFGISGDIELASKPTWAYS